MLLRELILFDRDPGVVSAMADVFSDRPEVTVTQTDLADLPSVDALITPANSYGYMDGGFDAAVTALLPGIQTRVREDLAVRFWGYQPVGTSMAVDTGSARVKWLLHTPTMRAPGPLGSRDDQVHDAMWAALLEVRMHNRRGPRYTNIRTLACPGLGTAIGAVEPRRAAMLMRQAYLRGVGSAPAAFSPSAAWAHHHDLTGRS